MEFTRSLVVARADEYAAAEPLYAVEQEHVDLLPGALAGGDYGWRDAEWVVQWYYRRHLGAYPDAERRAAEDAYRENDFDDVREAIAAAVDAVAVAEKLDRLAALEGVDAPVASAFLLYLFPARYVVVGEREWSALSAAGELDERYPDGPTAAACCRYLETCGDLVDRLDVDAWTLYRALWRLGGEEENGRPRDGETA